VYLADKEGSSSPRFSRQASGEIDTSCRIAPVTAMEISPGPGLGSVKLHPGPAGGWGSECARPASYLAELWPDDCCEGWTTSTQTQIDAPATVHPGERARFLIAIKNEETVHSGLAGGRPTPPTALTFRDCPTYHEELEGVGGSFHTYVLNCRTMAPLEWRQTAIFEMFIEVPEDAQAGPAVLLWAIDGSPRTFQTARTSIEILE
jgi:hypothetical protein